jgi:hypothetical protein
MKTASWKRSVETASEKLAGMLRGRGPWQGCRKEGIMHRSIIITVALAAALKVNVNAQALNTLSPAEKAAGWKLLFDGETLHGWRGYMKPAITDGWKVVAGALTRVARGGDIITTEKYRNFELSLEWRLDVSGGAASNSGVFFRAIEGPDQIYYSAPELQIVDDDRHPDGKSELTSAGANYALHPAPRGVVKPVGEWNAVRLVVNGPHVEHWLNGKKIVEYEIGSADWKERVAKSKFKQWPEYAQAKEGYIGLQDHGSFVAFRNIKIRVLPE